MRKGNEIKPQDGNIFKERLKYAMNCSRVKTPELAEAIGAGQPTVSAYRCGICYPSLDKAMKIAKVLNVSMDWLCGLED